MRAQSNVTCEEPPVRRARTAAASDASVLTTREGDLFQLDKKLYERHEVPHHVADRLEALHHLLAQGVCCACVERTMDLVLLMRGCPKSKLRRIVADLFECVLRNVPVQDVREETALHLAREFTQLAVPGHTAVHTFLLTRFPARHAVVIELLGAAMEDTSGYTTLRYRNDLLERYMDHAQDHGVLKPFDFITNAKLLMRVMWAKAQWYGVVRLGRLCEHAEQFCTMSNESARGVNEEIAEMLMCAYTCIGAYTSGTEYAEVLMEDCGGEGEGGGGAELSPHVQESVHLCTAVLFATDSLDDELAPGHCADLEELGPRGELVKHLAHAARAVRRGMVFEGMHLLARAALDAPEMQSYDGSMYLHAAETLFDFIVDRVKTSSVVEVPSGAGAAMQFLNERLAVPPYRKRFAVDMLISAFDEVPCDETPDEE